MQKISISSEETQTPENGLAIDESLLPKPGSPTKTEQVVMPTEQVSTQKGSMSSKKPLAIIIIVIALVAGVGTGYGVHQLNAGKSPKNLLTGTEPIQTGSPLGDIAVGDVYGSENESIFKDSTEGVVQSGGIDGEGSHHLVRPGGTAQTVYMTSTTVDLDKFVGAKVKVWGETFAAQKAGWLMDVGRVQVVELDAELPQEK